MIRPHRPLFISFEGGEGAGKSTLIQKLYQALIQQGKQVLLTREPGGSSLGEKIRQLLLNHNSGLTVCSKAELLLFLAARVQHIEEKIKPALQAGQIVLCDRFHDSTIAYQGAARGLGSDYVENLCLEVCDGLQPNLTFFLDIDPVLGINRTKGSNKENAAKGTLDRIEAEELTFHRKVREGMQALAKKYPQRIVTLDASQSADKVFQDALRLLESRTK